MFIGYVQNSTAYRFISLKDSSISEFRDVEFFEHIFHLKRNAFTAFHETIPMHDNVPLFVSSNGVKDSVNEPRTSKRFRVETSLVPISLQTS